jgi:hypothetical protein
MFVAVLQAALAPVLLRRMKEDVENLPEKEEVVIWVELTAEQRRWGHTAVGLNVMAVAPWCCSKRLWLCNLPACNG